jgi:hypothetical protein
MPRHLPHACRAPHSNPRACDCFTRGSWRDHASTERHGHRPLFKTASPGVLAPPILLAAALVAHSPHHTARGKEKGEEEEKRKLGTQSRRRRPSSSETEAALLVFFFTEGGLLCTARPLDSTTLNHHCIAILLPRARGEPLRPQTSSAHHHVHSGAAAAKTVPGTAKATPGPSFTNTFNHEHTLEHGIALRIYTSAWERPGTA